MPILPQGSDLSFDQVFYPLSEISDKDDKFRQWKLAANSASQLFLTAASLPYFSDRQRYSFDMVGHRIAGCSSFLHFGIDDGDLKLAAANFCRSRFCPICQWRRRLKMSASAAFKIDLILKKYPKHKWLFGTLTMANCPLEQLSENIDLLQTGFSKLIGTRCRSNSGSARYLQPLFKDDFAIFRTIEVTRGRAVFSSNGKYEDCHPHIHFLLMVSPDYSRKNPLFWLPILPDPCSPNPSWAELWRDSLDLDYLPIVHFRSVPKYKLSHDLNELFKYCSKPSDLNFSRPKDKDGKKSQKITFAAADLHFPHATAKFQAGLFDQISGKRLYGASGILRNFEKSLDDDDLIALDTSKKSKAFDDYLSFNWWNWEKNEAANNYVISFD